MENALTEEDIYRAFCMIWESVPVQQPAYVLMSSGTANTVERAIREGNALRRYVHNPLLRNLTAKQIRRATGKVRLPAYESMTVKKGRRRA